MKSTQPILLAAFILLFSTASGFAQGTRSSEDSLLYHIQTKIHDAFYDSFRAQNAGKLQTIEKKLAAINGTNRIVQYWRAYTLYNESIYNLQTGDKKASRKQLNSGITILKNIKTKDSEDYALLSLMQSFVIQFSGGAQAAGLAKKADKYDQKALNLDKKNVRAWYVRGLLDYYTSKQYGGGGNKAAKSLKKAVNLNEKNRNNPYLPTWGKAQAYGLLVSYYIKNNHTSKAKKVLQAGLKKFPGNFKLKQDEKKLAGK
jgi:hypothetical protein